MTNYQTGQEYPDLRWGMMPFALMAGGNIVEVRARGTVSVAILDPQKVAEVEAEPEDLPRRVQSLVAVTVIDWLGERGASAASVAELTTVTPQAAAELQAKLQVRLSEVGIQVNALKVEAVETI